MCVLPFCLVQQHPFRRVGIAVLQQQAEENLPDTGIELFTVVQEVSPWDIGFFMDILVNMDFFYYCAVLSAAFGEINKCFGDSFVDPGHLWLLGCNISSALRN